MKYFFSFFFFFFTIILIDSKERIYIPTIHPKGISRPSLKSNLLPRFQFLLSFEFFFKINHEILSFMRGLDLSSDMKLFCMNINVKFKILIKEIPRFLELK